MNRRKAIVLVGAAGVSTMLPATAQQTVKVPRIGFLWTGDQAGTALAFDLFQGGLRQAGYVEGRNIEVEQRWAANAPPRLAELAAELVAIKVDVIVTQGTPAAHAAKRATTSIPIVMAISADVVSSGLVTSLARPGGNVTGMTLMQELDGKRLEFLKDLIPTLSRVGVISDAVSYTGKWIGVSEIEVAGRKLKLQLQVLEIRSVDDIEKAILAATKARLEALIVLSSPILRFQEKRLADLTAKYHLPAIYQRREFVDAGGLMAYGPSDTEFFRRAADFSQYRDIARNDGGTAQLRLHSHQTKTFLT